MVKGPLRIHLWLVILSILVTSTVAAQTPPKKYGEISADEISMQIYPRDSSANAVYLFDFATSHVETTYVTSALIYERHARIKILNKNGLDWANLKILHSKSQELSAIRGTTYNLEHGEMVATQMGKESIFNSSVNGTLVQTAFALPNVKAGSIIEFSYTMGSLVTGMPAWDFQHQIPVLHSEYWATLPDYCQFKKHMQGMLSPTLYEVKNEYAHHWILKNVPAFVPEPNMVAPEDFISRVMFSLTSYQFPGRKLVKVNDEKWQVFREELLDDMGFGRSIDGYNELKGKVQELTSGLTDTLRKVETIFDYVRNTVTWNEGEDVRAADLKKVLSSKKGTSGDINVLLACLLDKAGIKTQMVVLSTRENGFIKNFFPTAAQFNYVICAVKTGGKLILADATQRFLPLGVLPIRCLNGKGLVVVDAEPQWIDLTTKMKSRTITDADITLSADGSAKGTVKYILDGYDGAAFRSQFFSMDKDEFNKKERSRVPYQIGEIEFQDVDNLQKPPIEKHIIDLPDFATTTDNLIYVVPQMTPIENPFISETRKFPIGYPTRIDRTNLIKLTIPEGFQVDELPGNGIIALPENAAKFSYGASIAGNVITVSINFQINKALFLQDEYSALREFYNNVIAKERSQIVLKRK